MHWQEARLWFCLLTLALCCSCSEPRDYGKKTVPVTGEVFVDGSPAATVSVTFHNLQGTDQQLTTVTAAYTKEDGKFAASTFEEGDGAPEGEYAVTFSWGEYDVISRSMGPDKLKKKYSDPKKSEFKITVSGDKPIDMGRIELTTK